METWQLLTVILGPTGGAWMGVKMSLNGMKARQQAMDGKLDGLARGQAKHGERLARLETIHES